MNITDRIRERTADYLWLRSLRRYQSRLGRRSAPRFTEYLERCRRDSSVSVSSDPDIVTAAQTFNRDGVAYVQTEQSRRIAQSLLQKIEREQRQGSIWDDDGRYARDGIFKRFPEIEEILRGDAGELMRSIYGTHYKVFFGVLYRSVRDHDDPQGSQIWHADGGPGTCINLMYCLSPVSAANGSMECLPWPESLEIYSGERVRLRAVRHANDGVRRDVRAEYYKHEIERRFCDRVVQPESGPGLLYAFRNNCIHKGGFVEPGRERYVIVFHVYPSAEPTPFDIYRKNGIDKHRANPEDPAF